VESQRFHSELSFLEEEDKKQVDKNPFVAKEVQVVVAGGLHVVLMLSLELLFLFLFGFFDYCWLVWLVGWLIG